MVLFSSIPVILRLELILFSFNIYSQEPQDGSKTLILFSIYGFKKLIFLEIVSGGVK